MAFRESLTEQERSWRPGATPVRARPGYPGDPTGTPALGAAGVARRRGPGPAALAPHLPSAARCGGRTGLITSSPMSWAAPSTCPMPDVRAVLCPTRPRSGLEPHRSSHEWHRSRGRPTTRPRALGLGHSLGLAPPRARIPTAPRRRRGSSPTLGAPARAGHHLLHAGYGTAGREPMNGQVIVARRGWPRPDACRHSPAPLRTTGRRFPARVGVGQVDVRMLDQSSGVSQPCSTPSRKRCGEPTLASPPYLTAFGLVAMAVPSSLRRGVWGAMVDRFDLLPVPSAAGVTGWRRLHRGRTVTGRVAGAASHYADQFRELRRGLFCPAYRWCAERT